MEALNVVVTLFVSAQHPLLGEYLSLTFWSEKMGMGPRTEMVIG